MHSWKICVFVGLYTVSLITYYDSMKQAQTLILRYVNDLNVDLFYIQINI